MQVTRCIVDGSADICDLSARICDVSRLHSRPLVAGHVAVPRQPIAAGHVLAIDQDAHPWLRENALDHTTIVGQFTTLAVTGLFLTDDGAAAVRAAAPVEQSVSQKHWKDVHCGGDHIGRLATKVPADWKHVWKTRHRFIWWSPDRDQRLILTVFTARMRHSRRVARQGDGLPADGKPLS